MHFMYNLEFHQLAQRINQLLNLIETYKFAIVPQNKKKAQYKQDIQQFIKDELIVFSDISLQRFSLPHYNYYQFILTHDTNPIEELTIGNTIKYLDTLQNQLLETQKLLQAFL